MSLSLLWEFSILASWQNDHFGFKGHIQQNSGLTLGSVRKDYSWQGSGISDIWYQGWKLSWLSARQAMYLQHLTASMEQIFYIYQTHHAKADCVYISTPNLFCGNVVSIKLLNIEIQSWWIWYFYTYYSSYLYESKIYKKIELILNTKIWVYIVMLPRNCARSDSRTVEGYPFGIEETVGLLSYWARN